MALCVTLDLYAQASGRVDKKVEHEAEVSYYLSLNILMTDILYSALCS